MPRWMAIYWLEIIIFRNEAIITITISLKSILLPKAYIDNLIPGRYSPLFLLIISDLSYLIDFNRKEVKKVIGLCQFALESDEAEALIVLQDQSHVFLQDLSRLVLG